MTSEDFPTLPSEIRAGLNSPVTRRGAIRFTSAATLGAVFAGQVAAMAKADPGDQDVPEDGPDAPSGAESLPQPLALAAGLDLRIPNGSFELKNANGTAAQWDTIGAETNNTALIDDSHFHDGQHSLKFNHGTSRALYVRSAPLPVAAGDVIRVSIWVRGESGVPGTVYLEFRNANNTRLSERNVTAPFSTEWQEVVIEGTAPAGTSHVTVLIFGSSAAGRTGVSYFDEVVVQNLSIPPYDPALGTEPELFIDNYRIAEATSIERVVQPGLKSGILVSPDRPWESTMVQIYGGALWDPIEGQYRMWYTAINAELGISICHATSPNGTKWKKPSLGLVEFEGRTDNNIVMAAPAGSGCCGVIIDESDPDPARRYKMMVYLASSNPGYYVFFSPDGLAWAGVDENPVLPPGDVANVAHDPERNRFIAMSKHPYGKRVAFVSTSTDFIHWSERSLALEADDRDKAFALAHGASDAQIYGMPAFPYGNGFIALPWMFELAGRGEPGTAGDGLIEVQIAYSRDLQRWDRPDRTPIIPVGVGGSWDQGMVFTANTPIVSDSEVIMYYSGWNGPHGASVRGTSIGRVVWQRDRFVSMTNGGDLEGVLTTKPITVNGGNLRVNVNARNSLRVEVLDAVSGEVIPGFGRGDCTAVRGDQSGAAVKWRGDDLSALAGREVVFRFCLLDGDLFAFSLT